jgi:subtilisin family serine protease
MGDELERNIDSFEPPGRSVDMDVIRTVVEADGVTASGYTGAGVRVGHIDTGCDFGNPDLRHAYDSGTYDATGYGLSLTNYHANSTPVSNVTEWLLDPYNMLTYEGADGGIYLDVDGWDPLMNWHPYGADPLYGYLINVYAGAWGIDLGSVMDYIREDWKLPDPVNVQGNYSVGVTLQHRRSPTAIMFAPSLVYNGTDNEHHLIINWEDALGLNKVWMGGIWYEVFDFTDIYDAYDIVTTFDFDFTDEFADGDIFDASNPIVYHDYGDPYGVFSWGALSWCYDALGYFDDEPIFQNFRSDGDAFCLYWDYSTHGTATASHIAGLGNTYANLDNGTTFQMLGIAPEATSTIQAITSLTSSRTLGVGLSILPVRFTTWTSLGRLYRLLDT